jgi:hypothetical protein
MCARFRRGSRHASDHRTHPKPSYSNSPAHRSAAIEADASRLAQEASSGPFSSDVIHRIALRKPSLRAAAFGALPPFNGTGAKDRSPPIADPGYRRTARALRLGHAGFAPLSPAKYSANWRAAPRRKARSLRDRCGVRRRWPRVLCKSAITSLNERQSPAPIKERHR